MSPLHRALSVQLWTESLAAEHHASHEALQDVRTTAGGTKAVTSGSGPANRSTSTRAVCALLHCASREVPLSRVSTLGLPCLSRLPNGVAGFAGSNQAPVASCTTPGRMASVTTAPARHEPRDRYRPVPRRPRAMPRAAASVGMQPQGFAVCAILALTADSTAVELTVEPRASADWRADAGGSARSAALPSHSAGSNHVACPGQSS